MVRSSTARSARCARASSELEQRTPRGALLVFARCATLDVMLELGLTRRRLLQSLVAAGAAVVAAPALRALELVEPVVRKTRSLVRGMIVALDEHGHVKPANADDHVIGVYDGESVVKFGRVAVSCDVVLMSREHRPLQSDESDALWQAFARPRS